jgi:hypothetical protein
MFSSLSTVAFGALVFSACTSEDPVNQVMSGDNRGLGDITDNRALQREQIQAQREDNAAKLSNDIAMAKIQSASSEKIAELQSKAQSENLQSQNDTFETCLSKEEKIIYFLLIFVKDKVESKCFDDLVLHLDKIEIRYY